jgi:RimJ/RimL family protein N-acetyltransferase
VTALPQPRLATARLLLRPFDPDDAPLVTRLAGDPAIAATTQNVPHPYEEGMAEAWIARHGPGWERGELAVYAVTEPGLGLVGAVGLRIEPAHRRAELGYWIGVPYWGRGYATEAAAELVRLGFGTLGLNRIYATHLTRNPASGRVMVKLGMRLEGCRREHIFKSGRYEDIAEYGLLRADAGRHST